MVPRYKEYWLHIQNNSAGQYLLEPACHVIVICKTGGDRFFSLCYDIYVSLHQRLLCMHILTFFWVL